MPRAAGRAGPAMWRRPAHARALTAAAVVAVVEATLPKAVAVAARPSRLAGFADSTGDGIAEVLAAMSLDDLGGEAKGTRGWWMRVGDWMTSRKPEGPIARGRLLPRDGGDPEAMAFHGVFAPRERRPRHAGAPGPGGFDGPPPAVVPHGSSRHFVPDGEGSDGMRTARKHFLRKMRRLKVAVLGRPSIEEELRDISEHLLSMRLEERKKPCRVFKDFVSRRWPDVDQDRIDGLRNAYKVVCQFGTRAQFSSSLGTIPEAVNDAD